MQGIRILALPSFLPSLLGINRGFAIADLGVGGVELTNSVGYFELHAFAPDSVVGNALQCTMEDGYCGYCGRWSMVWYGISNLLSYSVCACVWY